MNQSAKRRHYRPFSAVQKAEAVRRHPAGRVPVSDLADELGLQPSQNHTWVRQVLDQAEKAFVRSGGAPQRADQAILDYQQLHPLDGSRSLAVLMLDDAVEAVSLSSVCRVLKAAGRLDRKSQRASKKGTGFPQREKPHEHRHVVVSHINLAGTFYSIANWPSAVDSAAEVVTASPAGSPTAAAGNTSTHSCKVPSSFEPGKDLGKDKALDPGPQGVRGKALAPGIAWRIDRRSCRRLRLGGK